MSKEILRKLRTLKSEEVNPRADWVTENRRVLLSQIKNTVNPVEEKNFAPQNVWESLSILFSPSLMKFAMRPLIILLIVAVVGTSKIAIVDAAYMALPGDLLYPAKRAVESTQVVVTKVMGDQKAEIKLHSEFAKRRADEAKRIVVSADPQKAEKVTQTLTDLKQELSSVDAKLDSHNNVTADVAKDVKQDTEVIKDTLNQVKDNLIVDKNTTQDLAKQVSDAKDAVSSTDIKAVVVMAQKQADGDNTVSKDEVSQVINNTLNNVVAEVAQNKQNADDAKKVVEAVKSEVRSFTNDISKDSDLSVASVVSSTKALDEKIAAVAAQAKDAAQQTDAITKELDQKVTEAKALLSTGDLAQAMDKVQQAAVSSQKVQAITDNTIASVQNVLPVMSVVVKDNVASVIATSTNIVITVTTTPAINSTTQMMVPTIIPSASIMVSNSSTLVTSTVSTVNKTSTTTKK